METFTLSCPEPVERKTQKASRSKSQKVVRAQSLFTFAQENPLPDNYGECIKTREDRRSGKCCQHLRCRHNLIAELGRMNERDALRCARLRLRAINGMAPDEDDGMHADSPLMRESCALDIAEDKASGFITISDRVIASHLGTGMAQLRRETREIQSRVNWELSEWRPWDYPDCWAPSCYWAEF